MLSVHQKCSDVPDTLAGFDGMFHNEGKRRRKGNAVSSGMEGGKGKRKERRENTRRNKFLALALSQALDWVFSQWDHFTVHRFICVCVCVFCFLVNCSNLVKSCVLYYCEHSGGGWA